MNKRTELACLWCLPLGLVLFTVGWICAHYFPPPSSAMSAHAFQLFYIHHAGGMRVGFSLMAFGGLLTVPFAVAVMCEMLRIEGPRAPLAYIQLAMGVLVAVTFIVPLFPFAAAAYRPHSDPQLIRALADMFWLPYVMGIWPTAGQAIAMGALAFRRTGSNPLPRWFGYACLACSVGLLLSVLDLSHKTGPLGASGGLVGLWLPAAAGNLWYILSMVVFHRAITARAKHGLGGVSEAEAEDAPRVGAARVRDVGVPHAT